MTKFTFALDGRTALVTGAGQGVGREIARTFADHGAKIVVNDFMLDRAESVVAEIKADGGQAIAVQADVADLAGVDAMVARAERELGGVDILVNNAGNAGPDGQMPRLNFWETDPAEWDRYMRVNLHGVMVCTRACVKGMVERKSGRVITIISDAGRTGEQGHEAYSAAKAGAAGFSRALARAMGRYNVTVNTISLATVLGGIAKPSPEAEAMMKEALKRYIVRRFGAPADVAAMALLLASDAGSWLTGQNYPVNGGFSMAL